jgi:hypothetical protein
VVSIQLSVVRTKMQSGDLTLLFGQWEELCAHRADRSLVIPAQERHPGG